MSKDDAPAVRKQTLREALEATIADHNKSRWRAECTECVGTGCSQTEAPCSACGGSGNVPGSEWRDTPEAAMADHPATRLEVLQAQPVGEDVDDSTGAALIKRLCELHNRKMDDFITFRRTRHWPTWDEAQAERDLSTLTYALVEIEEQRAALTASPPVVEQEAIARIIDPSRWAVLDGYLADTLRKYKGQDIGYDPAAFKDKASLAKADAILALTPVEGVGERKTGWLIERDDPQGLLYRMASRFDRDHMKALRFARREDAQAFCDAFLTDHRHTVAHPQYTRIAEHAWD